MTSLPHDSLQPRRLLAVPRTKIAIAVVSILVLGVGAWLTPRAVQPTLSVPDERAAPLLEEQVQQRELDRTFIGVTEVADRVRPQTVAIPLAPRAALSRTDFAEPAESGVQVAGFGVFVSSTHVLSHADALDGRSSVPLTMSDRQTVDGRVVAFEPSTGLVLLETGAAAGQAAALAAEVPAAGALTVAVGHADAGPIAVPVFVTATTGQSFSIGGVHANIVAGMPVFTLDGELVAIATTTTGGARAVPAAQAAERLIARVAAGDRRASFGLGFQAPDSRLGTVFGETGVIVTDVLEGGPADRAGVEVGDVLVAVGGETIDSVATANRVLASRAIDTPLPLLLRRDRKERPIEVTPASAYEVAALARTREPGPSGPQARALFAPQVVEAAGLPPDAIVLRINGRPPSSRAQVQLELRRARTPVPVLLRDGDDRFFVAIDPLR